MDINYTPAETKTYTTPEEFTAVWEEPGNYKYRLKIALGVFELSQWNSAGAWFTQDLHRCPSTVKVFEAIEKYKDRLDIES